MTSSPGPIPGPSAGASYRGGVMGLSAYLIWSFFPLYFKALAGVRPTEVLCHRILWSAAFLVVFLLLAGRLTDLGAIFRDRRMLTVLCGTTLLVGTNWLVFIWAVDAGRVLESSLGYYINPLVSIVLANLFLGERLSRLQKISVGLAGIGVAVQTVMVGRLPLVSLTLAFTFGLYGLVRKAARVPAAAGLAVETLLTSPLAAIYLAWLMFEGRAVFMTGDTGADLLLLCAGAVTSVPLILYGGALNRVRLSTMGIMQYIVPTGHFFLAVFAFGEPFTSGHLAAFAFIWTGLVLYTVDSLDSLRPSTVAAGAVAPDEDR